MVVNVLWQAVVIGAVSIILAVLAYLTRRLESSRVELVASGKKLDLIHDLVNGAMTSQLLLCATVSRRLAALTKGAPEGKADEEAAALAEKLYAEHMEKLRAL